MHYNKILITCLIFYSHMLLSCSKPQLELNKPNLVTLEGGPTTQDANSLIDPNQLEIQTLPQDQTSEVSTTVEPIIHNLSLALGKANVQLIEKVFPDAFKNPTGIYVKPKSIADLDCYTIQEFLETEKNRNHFDDRPSGAKTEFLVMHYTDSHFPSTINWFTYNAPSDRASAHYVVTEEEKNNQIPGGVVFQVVPEEKTAWHAGISY